MWPCAQLAAAQMAVVGENRVNPADGKEDTDGGTSSSVTQKISKPSPALGQRPWWQPFDGSDIWAACRALGGTKGV